MFDYRGLVLVVVLGLSACGSLTKPATVRSVLDGNRSGDFKNVNALFSTWTKPNSAGCALGVLSDGRLLYSRGYGLADIEHSVPIAPTTVFHVASISKQFTAFAIYLLEQDGKLSIDDDIRKYLPELHDFHQTITIRQLLHHTSGLRDQWDLLLMAGWRLGDVITQEDVLKLTWRQEELNFPPGQEFLYSNTGYTLLAVIVERVSGMSFRDFTDQRIFVPLGMSHTHFHEHYGDLVPDRAYSYEWHGDSYRYVALSYSTVGASSLFTTVQDLARWDENFYNGNVGGKDLLAQMQIKGKLNSGKEIDYASGLMIGTYRGLTTVEHGGADAGFRSEILRFPDVHFSVIILCNAGDADPSGLARKTADIFLDSRLKPLPPALPQPIEVKIDPKQLGATQRPQLTDEQLQQFAGSFYSTEIDKSYTVLTRDGKLFISDARTEDEMVPVRADVFEADFPFNTVEYECTKTRRCNSFIVSNGRVRRLRFQRINLVPNAVTIKLSASAQQR